MKKSIVSIIVIFLFGSRVSMGVGSSKKSVVSSSKSSISLQDQRKSDYYFYEAVRQRQLKNYPETAELLAKCYYINPNEAAVLYEFAMLYTLMHQPKYALAYMENAMKKDPSNIWYKTGLAELFLQNKEYNLAIEVYENIAKYHPEKEDINYMRASLYKQTNQLNKSIVALNKVEHLTGINEAVSFEKYRVYTQLKNTKKANAEIDQLIKQFPNEMKYRILRGNIFVEAKQYEKGLSYYLQVKQEEPGNAMLQEALTDYYKQRGQLQKAKELLKESLSNPKITVDDKLAMFGRFLTQDGQQISEADEYFSILLGQYPDDQTLVSYYVSYLLMQNKMEEALPILQKLIEVSPDNEDFLIQLLEIYLTKSDFENVLKLTNNAIVRFPQNAIWYYYKTIVQFNFLQYTEAMETCNKGLKFVGEDNPKLTSRFYAQKGDLYAQQEQMEKAFEMYELGLQANDKNIVLLNNYAYFLSVMKKDLSKAEKMSAQTIAAEPKNSTYLDTYAWIFFVQGNYTLAKLYIEQALEYGGKESETIIEHYGDILYYLGEKENAIKNWQKALELGGYKSKLLQKKIETKTYLE